MSAKYTMPNFTTLSAAVYKAAIDALSAALATVRVGGRLTLTSGTPVLVGNVSGSATLYYTPHQGDKIPLYNGTTWDLWQFTEMSQAMNDATKSPAAAAANANYDVFVWDDAGTLRGTRGPLWQKGANVTMTIASPCVVTWAGHGFNADADPNPPIVFGTTGALPTGLVAGTPYYVKIIDANSFNVSATPGGANINTSGAQSGTQSAIAGNYAARGTGAGTSELELFEGRYVNKNAITNGPAARRGLYVGSIRSNASSQIDMHHGGSAAGGTAALLGVWNMYNRIDELAQVQDSTGGWTYTTAAWRAANGSLNNRASVLRGLDDEALHATYSGVVNNSVDNVGALGIGIDSASSPSGTYAQVQSQFSTGGSGVAAYAGRPGLGWHIVQALERSGGGATGAAFFGNAVAVQSALQLRTRQ